MIEPSQGSAYLSGLIGTTYKKLQASAPSPRSLRNECLIQNSARAEEVENGYVIGLSDGYRTDGSDAEDPNVFRFSQEMVEYATHVFAAPKFKSEKKLVKALPKVVQLIRNKAQELISARYVSIDASLTVGRVYKSKSGDFQYVGVNIGDGALVSISATPERGWSEFKTLGHPWRGKTKVGLKSANSSAQGEVEYIHAGHLPSSTVLLVLSKGVYEFLERQRLEEQQNSQYAQLVPETILSGLNQSSTQVHPRLVIQFFKDLALENEKNRLRELSQPAGIGSGLSSSLGVGSRIERKAGIGGDFTLFGVLLDSRKLENSKSSYKPEIYIDGRELEFLKGSKLSPKLRGSSKVLSTKSFAEELCRFLDYLKAEYGNHVHARRYLSTNNIVWNFIGLYRSEFQSIQYSQARIIMVEAQNAMYCGGIYQEFMSDPWQLTRKQYERLIY
jgi:hypothetical protein